MSSTQGINVLVVDDELGPRESLKMILKPFYNVFTAENGTEALKIIHDRPIDIATLDYKMPGMTGTELLREIRKFNEEMAVIMITGFGTMKSAVEGIRYGASDYLVKPFEVNEIIEIIKKNLDKRKAKTDIKRVLAELLGVAGNASDVQPALSGELSQEELAQRLGPLLTGLSGRANGHSSRTTTVINTLKDLIGSAENRSDHLNNHSVNVAYFSGLLGKKLGLEPTVLSHLDMTAALHDIGMLGYYYQDKQNREHEHHSSDAQSAQKADLGSSFARILELPEPVIKAISHLGEKYDGSGHPRKLQAEEIPLLSRIVCLSEAVENCYRVRRDRKQVIQLISDKSGTVFDPNLTRLLVELINENQIN